MTLFQSGMAVSAFALWAAVGYFGTAIWAGVVHFRLNRGHHNTKPMTRIGPPLVMAAFMFCLGMFFDGIFSPANRLSWIIYAGVTLAGLVLSGWGLLKPTYHGNARWYLLVPLISLYAFSSLATIAAAMTATARWGTKVSDAWGIGISHHIGWVVTLLSLVALELAIGTPIWLLVLLFRSIFSSRNATRTAPTSPAAPPPPTVPPPPLPLAPPPVVPPRPAGRGRVAPPIVPPTSTRRTGRGRRP